MLKPNGNFVKNMLLSKLILVKSKEIVMKRIFIFCIPMLFYYTGCGLCDPDTGDGQEDTSKYIGTFKLTAWNAPVPVDIDQNGVASRNLVTESTCYHPSKIILSADRNYVKHEHYPIMDAADATCGSVISSGIWSVQGNGIRLVSSNGDEEQYDYGEVNEILTRSESNWSYPTVTDGQGTYALGDVNMVFTKE
jgi:hypothetical protein